MFFRGVEKFIQYLGIQPIDTLNHHNKRLKIMVNLASHNHISILAYSFYSSKNCQYYSTILLVIRPKKHLPSFQSIPYKYHIHVYWVITNLVPSITYRQINVP